MVREYICPNCRREVQADDDLDYLECNYCHWVIIETEHNREIRGYA